MNLKTIRRYVAVGFALILVGVSTAALMPQSGNDQAQWRPVQFGRVKRTANFNGVVVPEARVSVIPSTGGQVLKVLRRRGDVVKAGDPLIEIESAGVDIELLRRQVAIEKLRIRLGDTRRDDSPAQDSRRSLELDLKLAEAEYRDALRASRARVPRAPVDGLIAQQPYRVGDSRGGPNASAIVIVDSGQSDLCLMSEYQSARMQGTELHTVESIRQLPYEVEHRRPLLTVDHLHQS